MTETHTGRCFCGTVELEVEGDPEAMGYCHCASCRSWSAAPVNAFMLFPKDNVRITKGAEHLGHFRKTENSDRQFCTRCGGHLMTDHPDWGLTDVYAATLPSRAFAPALHVHYAESVLHMADGLPKMRNIPSEMGGTGETMTE